MSTPLRTPDLFAPGTLGDLALPNRVVMAPMTRNRAYDTIPTPSMARYYALRADAGLLITEGAQISPEGAGYPHTPGIHSAEQVEGWRRVTDAVHEAGGRIALQLWHVGRISHPRTQPDGRLPVAPSAIAAAGSIMTLDGVQPMVTPRALETAELPRIVADFEAAARHARAAGFDAVEIHGANGYLLDQFLRDGTNRRTDAYGGPLANRVRLLREVAEAVVGVFGGGRVGVRFSPTSGFNGMTDGDPVATFAGAARALDDLGLAYLHLIEPAVGTAAHDPAAPRVAAAIREATRAPLILNGGFDRATADAALARRDAEAVAFGVPFLANPDLVRRLRERAPLNTPDRATFYGGDDRGYLDYPTLDEVAAVA